MYRKFRPRGDSDLQKNNELRIIFSELLPNASILFVNVLKVGVLQPICDLIAVLLVMPSKCPS
jgi:hypothetical protein